MANPLAITVHALAAEAAGSQTAAVDLGEIAEDTGIFRSACRLALELTAITAPATTQTGGGPAVTFSGVPDPTADFKIEITLLGALNVGKFSWSSDGGDTWTEEDVTLPAGGVYELGDTGVTATFAAGAYEDGTTYAWALRLLVTVETSADGATGWRSVDAFPAVNGHSLTEQAFVGLSRYVRVSWTQKAASVTFKVAGEAHQVFFARDHIFAAAIKREALDGIPESVLASAIIDVSDDIHDALNSAFKPPITKVGDSTRRRGAEIAAWLAIKQRGTDVDGADAVIRDAADKAEKWLLRVSQGSIKPEGIVDSTPERFEGGAVVRSQPRRGW